MKIAFALFAKPPVDDFVKTRLQKDLGTALSLQIYRLLLKWQRDNILSLQAGKNEFYKPSCTVFLAAPEDMSQKKATALFCENTRLKKVKFRMQQAGSLGTKMSHAFRILLSENDIAVLWGSDVPLIQKTHLLQMSALHPGCAIIPAADGGYSAISISARYYSDAIFQGIPWSTKNTLAFQKNNFEALKIPYTILDPSPDLDEIQDILTCIHHAEARGDAISLERINELNLLLKSARKHN